MRVHFDKPGSGQSPATGPQESFYTRHSIRGDRGFNDVISSFQKFGTPPNEATVFRFYEIPMISDLQVDVGGVKERILQESATSKTVIFNFFGVGALASDPLGSFINGPRKAGKEVIFCSVSDNLREELKVTKLEQLVRIYPTEKDALKELGVS